jgi:hypothetical protein
MPRRDLTLADEIALRELIKNQPPNTSSSPAGGDNCADFVQLQSIKRTWQGTPDQFLCH